MYRPVAAVCIINENELVRSKNGAQKQNVIWVFQAIPGRGVLARYYQASVSLKPATGPRRMFQSKRLELTLKNAEAYLRGIHDRSKGDR